ncbi:MAG TPA: cation:dicarboxylase symporter family transporter [Acidobacteriaceae bacterium]|nr:cation:dicarboxylase symporter family transporter [Acidobacteriaceae bacterium]
MKPSETTRSVARPMLWIMTVAGLLLYAVGIAVASSSISSSHILGLTLRVIAVALFAIAAFRRNTLTAWTFFAIVAGAEIGADAPLVGTRLHFLAEIFLRLVRLIVAPLIFGTLTTGIAAHREMKSLGRVALRTLIYFEVITTFALLLGALAIDISRAGEGVTVPAIVAQESLITGSAAHPGAPSHPGLEGFLLSIFPDNLVTAVADNQILQVAVFSILLGIALARIAEEKRAPLMAVLESMTAAFFELTRIIMYLAPGAAGAALAYTVGSMGVSTLLPLAKLLITFYAAAFAMVLLVFVPVMLLMRIPMRSFWIAVSEPAAIGFATSASQSALPLAMERMEEFGVPRWVVSFVIPSGYSFNMDGASLYLSIASIFAAQVAGMHLSVGQQLIMIFTLMLTSKGIAGVPRATLMILLATAWQFHLPSAPIMMILGIDALIDMGRTALNVLGNCLAAAVIGKWETGSLAPVRIPEEA